MATFQWASRDRDRHETRATHVLKFRSDLFWLRIKFNAMLAQMSAKLAVSACKMPVTCVYWKNQASSNRFSQGRTLTAPKMAGKMGCWRLEKRVRTLIVIDLSCKKIPIVDVHWFNRSDNIRNVKPWATRTIANDLQTPRWGSVQLEWVRFVPHEVNEREPCIANFILPDSYHWCELKTH